MHVVCLYLEGWGPLFLIGNKGTPPISQFYPRATQETLSQLSREMQGTKGEGGSSW